MRVDKPAEDQQTREPLSPWVSIPIVLGFGAWVAAYLIFIRPVINGFIFQFIPSFPAMLHLIPIFGIPFGLAILWQWLTKEG